MVMGEINRAYRSFDLNTTETLRPNKTSRFIADSKNNYETYQEFRDEFYQVGKDAKRFRQYLFTSSSHHKFWTKVFERTEDCIKQGGDSDVSQCCVS